MTMPPSGSAESAASAAQVRLFGGIAPGCLCVSVRAVRRASVSSMRAAGPAPPVRQASARPAAGPAPALSPSTRTVPRVIDIINAAVRQRAAARDADRAVPGSAPTALAFTTYAIPGTEITWLRQPRRGASRLNTGAGCLWRTCADPGRHSGPLASDTGQHARLRRAGLRVLRWRQPRVRLSRWPFGDGHKAGWHQIEAIEVGGDLG